MAFLRRFIVSSGAGRTGIDRAKNQRMAADLLARGYWHGRRASSPRPNSGGLTMVWAAGSAKYQRLVTTRMRRVSQ